MLHLILMAAVGSTTLPPVVIEDQDRIEVAYDALAAGQAQAAIAALEAERDRNPGEPAVLINLGSAYFQAGRYEDARLAFEAARTSSTRYELELADGSWADSRMIAQAALQRLSPELLASR